MKIAVIGGTGDMGYGIALRLGMAGHSVVIGSRDEARAQEAAQRAFAQLNQTGDFTGLSNEDAAAQAELCIISVPAKGHRATLTSLREVLQGKMVLDITVPMSFGPLRYDPPQEGSNALETAAILGENARIAAGMHTVSATLLQEIEKPLGVDALLVSSDKELKAMLTELLAGIGMALAGTLLLFATADRKEKSRERM